MFESMKRKIQEEGEVVDCSPEAESEGHSVFFNGTRVHSTGDVQSASRAYNALVVLSKGLAKFGLKYAVKIESDKNFRHN